MGIEVRVAGPLQRLTSGMKTVHAEGATTGQLIENLDALYPGFRDRLVAENGGLRSFINVFVNDVDIRLLQGLETPLKDGDSVSIIPAMAGGSGARRR